MIYDFTTKPEREGKDALAVDAIGKMSMAPSAPKNGFSLIPMWVADMNFKVFPGIQEKIIRRAEHPAFGYFLPRDEYYDAIIRWQEVRNSVRDLTKEAVAYENGVLGGVMSAVNALCSKGESILVHSPAYIGFTSSLTGNGYHIVFSPLVPDASGVPRMDLEDMERKIRENHIHVLVFCSPHNPCGRVWEQEELEQLSDLCEKYDVTVVSDEIWSDLIMTGHTHIPTQSATPYLHDNTAAFYAPSKTFNLAGLVGSYHIIFDKRLRDRVRKEASLSHYNNINVLSMHALIGAYSEEGMNWTDQLCEVIERNIDIACGSLEKVRGVSVFRPQGTYMIFPDFKEFCAERRMTMNRLEKACWDTGVAAQDGRMFFGKHNLRLNLALPTQYVIEAFNRLEKYVFNK